MSKEAKQVVSSGDLYQDLGFPPEKAELLNIKTKLGIEIENYIETNNLKQDEAAKKMGISRPRLRKLINGSLELFTVDALIQMLAKIGKRTEVKVKKVRVS